MSCFKWYNLFCCQIFLGEKVTMDCKSIRAKATLTNIPRTGRIGRFIRILENQIREEEWLSIIEGSQNYDFFTPEQKATRWRDTVSRMEAMLGKEKSVSVMTACGAKCCGNGQRKTAARLMSESDSIEELLSKLSVYEVKEGELEYQLVDEHTIIAKHNRCFCGQVKNTEHTHETDTYCQCSVEFNRQFFMAALNKPVKVKLNKSILNGADICEFIISI